MPEEPPLSALRGQPTMAWQGTAKGRRLAHPGSTTQVPRATVLGWVPALPDIPTRTRTSSATLAIPVRLEQHSIPPYSIPATPLPSAHPGSTTQVPRATVLGWVPALPDIPTRTRTSSATLAIPVRLEQHSIEPKRIPETTRASP